MIFINILQIQKQKNLQANDKMLTLSMQPLPRMGFLLTQSQILSMNNTKLSKGTFLIASPNLIGSIFSKSVILLLEYGKSGSIGIIINKPSDIKLKSILPKFRVLQIRNKNIFIGGPVSISTLFFMVETNKHTEKFIEIFDNVYLLTQFNQLSKTIPKKIIRKQLRIYAGYAGWAPGQLEYEISRGDWYLYPADVNSIFFKNSKDIWPYLINKSSAQWIRSIVNYPSLSQKILFL